MKYLVIISVAFVPLSTGKARADSALLSPEAQILQTSDRSNDGVNSWSPIVETIDAIALHPNYQPQIKGAVYGVVDTDNSIDIDMEKARREFRMAYPPSDTLALKYASTSNPHAYTLQALNNPEPADTGRSLSNPLLQLALTAQDAIDILNERDKYR